MEENFLCPYCGSENSLFVDYSQGRRQEFVLDCQTCCRPIVIKLKMESNEVTDLRAEKENS